MGLATLLLALLLQPARPAVANGPFVSHEIFVGGNSRPAFVDIDADGDQDAFGTVKGSVLCWENRASR